MKRIGRIALRTVAALAVLLAIVTLAGVLVVRSGWFREQVRARILFELERATGGRAELGQFAFDWKALTAEVQTLVVHGKESESEPPLLRIGSATVGLRIISALERDVDLASVRVDRPEVRIIVYPDGSTNLPGPGTRSDRSWADQLLRLRVKRYEIHDAIFALDQRVLPMNLSGEDLQIEMQYDPAGPAYQGDIASRKLRFTAAGEGPIELGFAGGFRLDKDRIAFPKLQVTTAQSRVDLDGAFEDVRSPRGSFNVGANVSIREAVRLFRLPIGPQGSARFDGKLNVTFGSPFDFSMDGRVAASGVGFVRDRLKVENALVRSAIQLTRDRLTMRGIRAEALDATITGDGELTRWRQFKMDGRIEGLSLRRAAAIFTDRPVAWSGTLAGPFSVEETIGAASAKARGTLAIMPGGEGIPVEGQVDASYDQVAGTVDLGSSWVSTPATRVDVSGTLGKVLRVKLQTSNPDDLLPAIAMADSSAPSTLPLKLNNGSAAAEGTVTGPLDDPRFAGQVAVTNGVAEGHAFDRLTAQVEATKGEVQAQRLILARGSTEVTGTASVTARNGSFEDGLVTAALTAKGVDIAAVAQEFGTTSPLQGMASATVRLAGTVRSPEAEISADVAQPEAYGERVDRLRATVRYKTDGIEILNGEATDGGASVRFGGSYRKNGSDWKSGDATFDVSTQNLPLSRIDRAARIEPSVDAAITGRARGAIQFANGEPIVQTINADLAAERILVDKQAVGNAALTIETRGQVVDVLATGRVRESTIESRGSWTLTGNHSGSGTLRFSRIGIGSLHELSMLGRGGGHQDDVPFEGFVEGRAAFNVSLRTPDDLTAQVTLDTVQANPKQNQALRLGVQPQDLVVRNVRPVVMNISKEEIRVQPAQFSARDTSLEVSGAIPLRTGSNADLAVRGNVSLSLLQLFNAELLARGDATVEASVRGNMQNPNVNGRLAVKGASLYFSDLPNGIDNANGTILFDRNRATVEKLTAETGGGTISFGGVVEFASPLQYRLQATAQRVRVRYPEDLSTTFDARLALSGTPAASSVTGTVTLNRAAFNPRTDLGQLLAQASRPTPVPSAPNQYLQGMQFEVRIESAPNFSFETSLTRDVEAEVDLNLHGTPLRPILLGTVSVNQGEVQVFGNRYTIDRGEVRFLNPVKVEPVLDLELATRARGITVNISLAGTPQQMKVNYSSDPPLQPSEIIALLAVGRDPQSLASPTTNSSSSSALAQAGSGLLGQAVNAQISSRLQRFFGASRVKVDPTLTGVDNIPQARLTIEQQVSKDITFTYITNLNRTTEQIVRMQWDFNRNWSTIAVRDQNGLFGVDFQYRKRF